jgi:hypothetical protein
MAETPNIEMTGVDLGRAIDLRWTLRDIRANRTKLSPLIRIICETSCRWVWWKCEMTFLLLRTRAVGPSISRQSGGGSGAKKKAAEMSAASW